jgi:hypothetical protein
MLWELEALQPPATLAFVRDILPPDAYRGNTFLPMQATDDVEFQYIKGAQNLPVMAHVIAWDSEAPMGSRPQRGSLVQGELPPMKRKEMISEKEILRFLTPRLGTSDQQAVVREVYSMMGRLTESILARVEWLQMQALSEDTVVYNESGIEIEFDYGINDLQQIDLVTQTDGTGASVASKYGAVWTDRVNATPVSDLMTICDEVELRTGVRPSRMVMSRSVYSNLIFNEEIKGLTYPDNAPDRPLTQAEVNATLARYNLPTISTYDVTMNAEAADGSLTPVRAMAANKAFILPGNNVGSTLSGPTAESRSLIGTQYSQIRSGIWASSYGHDEPPTEWAKVAAVMFPSMPQVHQLVQMKLAA